MDTRHHAPPFPQRSLEINMRRIVVVWLLGSCYHGKPHRYCQEPTACCKRVCGRCLWRAQWMVRQIESERKVCENRGSTVALSLGRRPASRAIFERPDSRLFHISKNIVAHPSVTGKARCSLNPRIRQPCLCCQRSRCSHNLRSCWRHSHSSLSRIGVRSSSRSRLCLGYWRLL